jgi:hypothetical protein
MIARRQIGELFQMLGFQRAAHGVFLAEPFAEVN